MVLSARPPPPYHTCMHAHTCAHARSEGYGLSWMGGCFAGIHRLPALDSEGQGAGQGPSCLAVLQKRHPPPPPPGPLPWQHDSVTQVSKEVKNLLPTPNQNCGQRRPGPISNVTRHRNGVAVSVDTRTPSWQHKCRHHNEPPPPPRTPPESSIAAVIVCKVLMLRGGVGGWVKSSKVWDPSPSYTYGLGGWVCSLGPPLYLKLLAWVGGHRPIFFKKCGSFSLYMVLEQ